MAERPKFQYKKDILKKKSEDYDPEDYDVPLRGSMYPQRRSSAINRHEVQELEVDLDTQDGGYGPGPNPPRRITKRENNDGKKTKRRMKSPDQRRSSAVDRHKVQELEVNLDTQDGGYGPGPNPPRRTTKKDKNDGKGTKRRSSHTPPKKATDRNNNIVPLGGTRSTPMINTRRSSSSSSSKKVKLQRKSKRISRKKKKSSKKRRSSKRVSKRRKRKSARVIKNKKPKKSN